MASRLGYPLWMLPVLAREAAEGVVVRPEMPLQEREARLVPRARRDTVGSCGVAYVDYLPSGETTHSPDLCFGTGRRCYCQCGRCLRLRVSGSRRHVGD